MNKKSRELYLNEEWHLYSGKVKNRDEYKCLQCGRGEDQVVLQVHHEEYTKGKKPWEYPLSVCRTLCKGCHAREHDLLEPTKDWLLVSVHDLGELAGTCEREGCGSEIRYEYLVYHPDWGHMIVGSTCVEFLTEEDKLICDEVMKTYKDINKFIKKSEWGEGATKKGYGYIRSCYKRHTIRIYGLEYNQSFQIVLKLSRLRREFLGIISAKNKSPEEVKELAYIVLKGTISKSEEEKEILRDIYRRTR